jgi:hypothetical protein
MRTNSTVTYDDKRLLRTSKEGHPVDGDKIRLRGRLMGKIAPIALPVLLTITLQVAVASAQSAASPAASSSPAAAEAPKAQPATGVEEIVVTAQKREQLSQDVPIALTAFSAQTIQFRGIEDMSDLAMQTPGLQFGLDTGADQQIYFVASASMTPRVRLRRPSRLM